MLHIILLLILLGACSYGVFHVLNNILLPKLTDTLSSILGSAQQSVKDELVVYDSTLERCIDYAKGLLPALDLANAENAEKRSLGEMNQVKEELQKFEGELGVKQVEVDKQEAANQELKKGREESALMADEIRSHQEELKLEAERLKKQFEDSKGHLDHLAGGIELTAEQEEALASVQKSVADASEQLEDFSRAYEVATSRFLNLERQYTDLEKEYRKLVDQELSSE